jgi:hypothetical protein
MILDPLEKSMLFSPGSRLPAPRYRLRATGYRLGLAICSYSCPDALGSSTQSV